MLKISKLIAVSALVAAPLPALADLSETGEFLDGVAAVVNEGVVMRSQLAEETANIIRSAQAQNIPLPPADILREQVLERLIVKEIQLQRAERIGLQVSDAMLNQAIEQLAMQQGIRFEDMPALLAVTLLTVSLFLDSYLSRVDGIVMLTGLVIVMIWLARLGLRSAPTDPIKTDFEAEIPENVSMPMALIWLALGLGTLLMGAHLLVGGSLEIAKALGVSEVVIGILLVGVGGQAQLHVVADPGVALATHGQGVDLLEPRGVLVAHHEVGLVTGEGIASHEEVIVGGGGQQVLGLGIAASGRHDPLAAFPESGDGFRYPVEFRYTPRAHLVQVQYQGLDTGILGRSVYRLYQIADQGLSLLAAGGFQSAIQGRPGQLIHEVTRGRDHKSRGAPYYDGSRRYKRQEEPQKEQHQYQVDDLPQTVQQAPEKSENGADQFKHGNLSVFS